MVLAYCIMEAASDVRQPGSGVAGMPLVSVAAGRLRGFISQFQRGSIEGTAFIRDAALEFHRVLQELFKQAALVPFRFPTILTSEDEFATYLNSHSAEYEEALTRLRDAVQIEMRIESQLGTQTVPAQQSGGEYLRSRQAEQRAAEQVAGDFQQAAQPRLKAWRMRKSSVGLRCYALIARADFDSVIATLKRVHVAKEFKVRVTGPWPATEFLKGAV